MAFEEVGVRFESQGFGEFLRNLSNGAKAVATMGKMSDESLDALRMLDDSLTKTSASGNLFKGVMDKASDSLKDFGDTSKKVSLSKSLSGVLEGLGKAALVGAQIGGVLGTLIGPPIGNALGAVAGALIATLAKLQINIIKALFDFFGSIGEAVTSFLPDTVRKIVSAGAKIATAFINIGKTIITAAGDAIKGLLSVFGINTNSLGDSLLKSMIKFEILKQVIRKVIQTIKDLARSAIDAAITLQTLDIRLDNLIARQARAAGATDDYAESIRIANLYSEELLNWLQKLALETPFGVDIVSETASLALAMGWGVDATKELTSAITDYAAGAGLSNDVMERIIYNFAQMRQAGKVTGTELRDLARGAFLPVNDILNEAAKELGIAADSMDEFRESAANGTIDVETFFDAFITIVNRDFPDAARRMNYTFAAVKDNLQDVFKTVIGWNILKPVIEVITKPMQDFLKIFSDQRVINNTKLIGQALASFARSAISSFNILGKAIGNVFNAIGLQAPTIENVVKTLVKFGLLLQALAMKIYSFVNEQVVPIAQDLRAQFGDNFEGLSDDMFTWGFKTIVNFAAGIARGISTVLVSVMNALSSFLAHWLAPGSPPLVAPDIDTWGMNTIAEWLHGFTEADFDVIESLQGALRGSLEALVDLGVLGEDAVLPLYRDISVELIAAMNELNQTGSISEDIFERLTSIGGVYGEELATLLQLQVDLAFATENVAAAQEAYNAAVEATQLSTATTNSMVREYNALLRGGADQGTLDQRLQALQAAQMQLEADRERELAAEAELEAAEDALDPIREAVALQERLIEQLIELARIQGEINDDNDGGGGAGGGGVEPMSIGGELFDWGDAEKTAKLNLGAIIEGLIDTARQEFAGLGTILADAWGDPFAPVEESWNNLMTNIEKAWAVLTEETFPKILEIIELFKDKETGEDGFFSNLFGGGNSILLTLDDINKGLDTMYDIAKLIRDNWDKVRVALLGIGIILAGWKVGGILGGIIALAGIGTTLGAAFSALVPIIMTKLNEIRDNIGAWLDENILTPIKNFFGITDAAETGSGRMAMLGNNIIQGLIDGIYDKVATVATTIVGWMDEHIVQPIQTFFGVESPSTLFATIGENLIIGLANGIIGVLSTIWETYISAPFNGMVNSVLAFFGVEKDSKTSGDSGVFYDIGTAIIDGFKNGIVNMVTTLWATYIATPFQSFVDSVLAFFGMGDTSDDSGIFSDIGVGIVQGLISGMISKIGDLIAAAQAIAGSIPETVRDWLNEHSPSQVMFNIGVNVVEGLINGIESKMKALESVVAQMAQTTISGAETEYEMMSPSHVFDEMGQNLMLGLSNGVIRTASKVSGTINKAIGSTFGSSGKSLSMPVSVSAMPMAGGNTVTFGDVYLSDRLDLATLKSYVQQMIVER